MEELVSVAACLPIKALLGGLVLWLAGTLTGIQAQYISMVKVVGLAALVEIPFFLAFLLTESTLFLILGLIISAIIFIAYLRKVTRADLFPDISLMTLLYLVIMGMIGGIV